MIVVRIRDGTGRVGQGSCRIALYDNGDWFPVESFNFGFEDSQRDKQDDGGGAPSGGGSGGAQASANRSGGSGKGGPKQRGGGDGKGHKDFAELSIEKQVDSTTCYLMYLAMEERQTKKGVGQENKRKISADIHVLASVQAGSTPGRYIYPSVLIHLEAVNILSWNIAASGDGRPTETLKIRYDRAAMIYCATADGKTFMQHGPKGWDQTQNKDYDSSGEFKWTDFNTFLPKGTKTAN